MGPSRRLGRRPPLSPSAGRTQSAAEGPRLTQVHATLVSGGQIWRTVNGTAWSQVSSSGFGEAANYGAQSLVEFDHHLYAGTRNDSGCEVWRDAALLFADGFESGDTSEWSAVVP